MLIFLRFPLYDTLSQIIDREIPILNDLLNNASIETFVHNVLERSSIRILMSIDQKAVVRHICKK